MVVVGAVVAAVVVAAVVVVGVRACGSRRFHLPLPPGAAQFPVLDGARPRHSGE